MTYPISHPNLLEQWFDHGPIVDPNVNVCCNVCGATVADWGNQLPNDWGLRPNQDLHVRYHMRRGERPVRPDEED